MHKLRELLVWNFLLTQPQLIINRHGQKHIWYRSRTYRWLGLEMALVQILRMHFKKREKHHQQKLYSWRKKLYSWLKKIIFLTEKILFLTFCFVEGGMQYQEGSLFITVMEHCALPSSILRKQRSKTKGNKRGWRVFWR